MAIGKEGASFVAESESAEALRRHVAPSMEAVLTRVKAWAPCTELEQTSAQVRREALAGHLACEDA